MPRHHTYPSGTTYTPGKVEVSFTCTLNNTSSPLASTYVPLRASGITSVTRTATGVHTVMFSHSYAKCVFVDAVLSDDATTPDGRYATISDLTVGATTMTAKVGTFAANGTPTDYTTKLRILAMFKDSSVNG